MNILGVDGIVDDVYVEGFLFAVERQVGVEVQRLDRSPGKNCVGG